MKLSFDWFCFGIGLLWCILLYILAICDIGKTLGPSIFTFSDAIWMPFVGAVFPFVIGLMSNAKIYFDD